MTRPTAPETSRAAPVEPAPSPTRSQADRLKGQAAADARRQKQLTIVAAVAVAAFLFLIYLPSASTLASLRERISDDAMRLQADRERGRALPRVRAQADLLEQQLAEYRTVAAEPALHEFIRRAGDLSLQMQLRDLKYDPLEASPEGSVVRVPVRLTLWGNFANVYGFLRQCEQSPHLVRVREMRIAQRPGATPRDLVPGEVSLDLTLELFHDLRPAVRGQADLTGGAQAAAR